MAMQLTLQLAVKLMKLHLKLAMQLSSVVRRLRTTDEGEHSENLQTDVFGHGEKNPTNLGIFRQNPDLFFPRDAIEIQSGKKKRKLMRQMGKFSDTVLYQKNVLDLKWLCSWLCS